jgi:cbb3-type cytochrome oxidase maturation protein
MTSVLILIVIRFVLGLGAWLVFLAALRSGQFDDVEGPKYRMLDDDEPAGGDNTTQGDRHDD